MIYILEDLDDVAHCDYSKVAAVDVGLMISIDSQCLGIEHELFIVFAVVKRRYGNLVFYSVEIWSYKLVKSSRPIDARKLVCKLTSADKQWLC